MRRVVVPGGEAELALLLDLFPAGVEELDGAFAVYVEEAGEEALRKRVAVAAAAAVEPGWEEAWRAFHHDVRVGRCWVGPPWDEPAAGAIPVVIDPGRAFGTGAHATTRLSLELLQELEPGPLLDVGCGSGVLAIAGAKLGFGPVTALDVDEAAVEATRANAAANGVEVAALRADALGDPLPPAAIAVANIALEAVQQLASRLETRLFVASGYLDRDEPLLPGWRRSTRRTADGWAGELFVRP